MDRGLAMQQRKVRLALRIDETILILEGSIVLESDAMPPTRYGPGDVIFFREGAHAKWHVESKVRKLAFCRKTQPICSASLCGFSPKSRERSCRLANAKPTAF